MNDSGKKALYLSAAILSGTALVGAAVIAATDAMVKGALSRNEPKIIRDVANRRFANSEEKQSFMETREITSDELANTENETVRITAGDGTELVGHLVRAENPQRFVLAMHGWRSSWHLDFGIVAPFYHKCNCTVLYVEQRGQNNSGGEYMGFGLTERYDCLDWIFWINEHLGTDLPLYLSGISMGAATVLMATGLALPENIHGVIADCGFTSPKEIWKHVTVNNLHLSYQVHGKIADQMFRQKLNMNTDDYSTVDALKESNIPVIFIHGANDCFVPIWMTYTNYQVCHAPKRLLVVPGADHGMSYFTEKDRYETAVCDFFRDFDDRVPVKKEEI